MERYPPALFTGNLTLEGLDHLPFKGSSVPTSNGSGCEKGGFEVSVCLLYGGSPILGYNERKP